MQRYATTTTVPPERTRDEIERTLKKWGVTEFIYGSLSQGPVIAFKYRKLTARFQVLLPDRDDLAIVYTPKRHHRRTPGDQEKAYDQAVRQRWRSLLLLIKAKLEAIEMGIASFEGEFLPYMVLPDGRTVSEGLMPEIYRAAEAGSDLPMLPTGIG